jgi:hypothetical protein
MKNKGFAPTPNKILNSPDISFKAKGIWSHIKSKPHGWRFSTRRIALQSKDGKEAVASGLHELEEKGYLLRKPTKKKDGSWGGYDYHLAKEPFTHNQSTVNPSTKNLLANSKKDNSNKENSKKEGEGKTHSPSQNKKADKKKEVKYSDILNTCEPHLKAVSLHTGVNFHEVRDVLRKMASYYVAEGKSFSNWTAKLINWIVGDLKKGDLEIDPFVVQEAKEIEMRKKRTNLIVSAFGEKWQNNKDLVKSVNDFFSSKQGIKTSLTELQAFLEELKLKKADAVKKES